LFAKTALTQLIFHHGIINAQFPVRMWVHVSGTFQLNKQLKVHMMHPFGGDANGAEDCQGAYAQLTGKRAVVACSTMSHVTLV
jgi:hypothetical protein